MLESCSSHLATLNTAMREMTFKVKFVLTIVLVLSHRSWAGVISLESEPLHGQHVALASSYMHFHGPVEGPEFEVKVPYDSHQAEGNHLHGAEEHTGHEYTLDYVGHPKYEFSYGVEDHHTGDFHGQKETRDGNSVSGQYSVKEPGGSVRVVSYHADKDGFHAVVHTSGKNSHTTDLHAGQDHTQVHGHESIVQQDDDLHDYANPYGHAESY